MGISDWYEVECICGALMVHIEGRKAASDDGLCW